MREEEEEAPKTVLDVNLDKPELVEGR